MGTIIAIILALLRAVPELKALIVALVEFNKEIARKRAESSAAERLDAKKSQTASLVAAAVADATARVRGDTASFRQQRQDPEPVRPDVDERGSDVPGPDH